MKKIINKVFLLSGLLLALVGCEEDLLIYDNVNGEAIATFQTNSPSPIIFNPAAETQNVYTVSVSTKSNVDRQVRLSVDPESTMDPQFYEISTLNPVIPAGEFSTDIIITTPASNTFPDSDSELILNLDSVEGAEIKSFSTSQYSLGFTVQCPEVDLNSIPGTYQIVEDAFGVALSNDGFEIVVGPGDNQFTMINPFGHPNPEAGGEMNYEVTFTINPNNGNISVSRQNAWHYSNFAASPAYGVGRVEGSGLALTCISQISFNLTHTVAAGSFGQYGLTIRKM